MGPEGHCGRVHVLYGKCNPIDGRIDMLYRFCRVTHDLMQAGWKVKHDADEPSLPVVE